VLVGTVLHVADGDTIKVRLGSGPVTVRLASVDAPEHDQPGGLEARSALARRVDGRQVEIAVETQDQYDRLVAFVHLGGENINSWLVQQGHAWAYRQYMSDPRYCIWEADARTYRRGLWGSSPGSPKAPWEWRRSQREPGVFRFTSYQRETGPSCLQAMRSSLDERATVAASAPPARQAQSLPRQAERACRIKGNISENGKVYHLPGSDDYELTQVNESRGERWFCTEQEALAAGWRAPR
jgi:endonuclease YncB( thermonuclease family)